MFKNKFLYLILFLILIAFAWFGWFWFSNNSTPEERVGYVRNIYQENYSDYATLDYADWLLDDQVEDVGGELFPTIVNKKINQDLSINIYDSFGNLESISRNDFFEMVNSGQLSSVPFLIKIVNDSIVRLDEITN